MENRKYYSVTTLNRYIAQKFDVDQNLKEVYLKGEISNFKISGKHFYFSIKDEESELSAMFFYPSNLGLKFKPQDGMSVQLVGKIQVYLKRGTYSIIVNQMEQAGLGLLYQQFLDLKDKLAKEGMFDPNLKRKIPTYPEVVGVITSPNGDAIHDIISTFNRRIPPTKLKIYPALVQGQDAPKDLIRALKLAYLDSSLDVIIIGRGGGSFEDLSCFNDEKLARVLAASTIPTVSAIGHQADYTICDFVASYRAPTPTGAAMALSKDRQDVIEVIQVHANRLNKAIKMSLTYKYHKYERVISAYGFAHFNEILQQTCQKWEGIDQHLRLLSPISITNQLEQKVLGYKNNLELTYKNLLGQKETSYNFQVKSLKPQLLNNIFNKKTENLNQNLNQLLLYINSKIDKTFQNLNNLQNKIVLLNPFAIMDKGFSIIYQNNKIISRIKQLDKTKPINVKMTDGEFIANIIKIKE